MATTLPAPVEANTGSELLCQDRPNCLLTLIASLSHAPFPYHGQVGDLQTPFLDGRDPVTHQPYHTVTPGLLYLEDPHYLDNRVLIHLPKHFKKDRPFEILLFFHGHNSELRQSLLKEMALIEQINATGRNLILIAPQMALNAMDSSPGKLYRPQGFKRLLVNVEFILKHHLGKKFARKFNQAPIILAAFSGGYRAVAYTLDRGFASGRELDGRIKGVILLDALFGELEKFQHWLQRPTRQGFFINLHTTATRTESMQLEQRLRNPHSPWHTTLTKQIKPKQIYSLPVTTEHMEIPLAGPPEFPLTTFLQRVK